MLKDIFKKKESLSEKILDSFADGFIDIKMYECDDDGNKKLVYHDSGDNTVTDWMRDTIVMLLAGFYQADESTSVPVEKMAAYVVNSLDASKSNLDTNSDFNKNEYSKSGIENYGAIFPTKVLFGTGKEYTSWSALKEENEINNKAWYDNIVEMYGNGSAQLAEEQFEAIRSSTDNTYTATVGGQGIYNGNASLVKTVFVEDPDNLQIQDSVINMSKRYGVVGGIRTFYRRNNSSDKYGNTKIINPALSTSGKLLRTQYRGAGYPSFIYFNRKANGQDVSWNISTSDVFVNSDSSSSFKNRITFNIKMPAQKTNESYYYPYNGVLLKQIGLYNDAFVNLGERNLAELMPHGTLLAVKNILPFTKFASSEISISWTLTV